MRRGIDKVKVSLFAALLLGYPAAMTADRAAAQTSAVHADHLALHVGDQDASVAFYQGAFGLAEIHAPVDGPRWFDLGGGMSLHLIPGRTDPISVTKSVHLALRVPSIERVTSFLSANGIAWGDWGGTAGAVTLRPDGVRQIYVRDPDGYWLEINQPAD